jgi:hypothetical protein
VTSVTMDSSITWSICGCICRINGETHELLRHPEYFGVKE